MPSAGKSEPLIWLSHFVPFPPRGGAFQRSYYLLRQASRHHEILLVAFNRPAADGATLRAYGAELKSFCSEVEFWELPFAWHGVRWWTGLMANSMQALPFSCELYRSPRLLRRWTEIVKGHPDALIHLDSSDLAVFAAPLAGRRAALNHHNCESAMAWRRARLEPNPIKKALLASQARKQASLERDLCPRVSVNAVVSAADAGSLRQNAPTAHIHVVANGTDTDYFVPDPRAIRRNTVVFTGTLNWYPNVSALAFFRRRIWPRLRAAVPDISCIIAGRDPVPEIVAWGSSDDGVTLVDSPSDVRPFMNMGAVFVCPIVDGGGTRLKLLDAMSSGKAIVTTSIGAEGLDIQNGRQALIADSDDDFVRATLEVLGNADLQQSLARAGREFVERTFGWNMIGRELEAAYRCTGCAS